MISGFRYDFSQTMSLEAKSSLTTELNGQINQRWVSGFCAELPSSSSASFKRRRTTLIMVFAGTSGKVAITSKR